MILITPDDGPTGLSNSIAELEQQLSGLRVQLGSIQRRIMDGELGEVANATKAIIEIRHWVRLALELEIQLAKHRQRERGIVHGFAIDFEEARTAISRRLDRLARSRGGQ